MASSNYTSCTALCLILLTGLIAAEVDDQTKYRELCEEQYTYLGMCEQFNKLADEPNPLADKMGSLARHSCETAKKKANEAEALSQGQNLPVFGEIDIKKAKEAGIKKANSVLSGMQRFSLGKFMRGVFQQ